MRWVAAVVLGAALCGCGHPVTVGLAIWLAGQGGHKKESVPRPSIVTDSLPAAVKGVSYEAVLQAEGGTPPYTWDVAGLPDGLGCDPTTGRISGTPTENGTFTLDVTVTDQKSQQGRKQLQLVVKVVAITTELLPDAAVNVAYSFTLQAIGGASPYTWSCMDTMPPGLTLRNDGTITGTPTEAGDFTFTVQVQENGGATDQKTLTLHVGTIAITTTTLPDGIVGQTYGPVQLEGTGGDPVNYQWSWSGNTPPGLHLSNDGRITGTPTQEGDYTFAITLTDGSETASKDFTVKIWPDLVITTTSPLPEAHVGEDYDFQLEAEGGSGQYQWSWSGDTPPLTLETDGRIHGTPQSGDERTYNFTVTVTDLTNGDTATLDVSLTIRRFRVTTATLPHAFERFSYDNVQLEAADGTEPYTWQQTGGTLPPGLTLNPDGTITGTPSVGSGGQVYSFNLQVTDAEGRTAGATLSITVHTTQVSEHFHTRVRIANSHNTDSFGSYLRLSPDTSHDDPSITVGLIGSYWVRIGGDNRVAQTITTNGGNLYRISVRVRGVDYTSSPQPIYAEIWTLDANGMPDQQVASSVRTIGFVGWPGRWRSFAFNTSLPAGSYMVIFHSPAPFELRAGQDDPPYTGGDLYTSTDGGSTWQKQSGDDMDIIVTFVDSYNASGDATIWEVAPSMPGNWAWQQIRWSADVPTNTSLTVQVLYFNPDTADWEPVPDTDLPGNSTGFDASTTSTIDISGLDTTTYDELRVKFNLSTTDTTTTPAVDWVELTWQPVP